MSQDTEVQLLAAVKDLEARSAAQLETSLKVNDALVRAGASRRQVFNRADA
jgi:hypothetical protein